MSGVHFFKGYDVDRLNFFLAHAEVKTSFWGERRVVVEQADGALAFNVNLLSLRNKVADVAEKCLEHINTPFEPSFLQQRLIADTLATKVNSLLEKSNENIKVCNFVTRMLVLVREIPYRLEATMQLAKLKNYDFTSKAELFAETWSNPINFQVNPLAFRTFSKEEFTHLFMQDQLWRGQPLDDLMVRQHISCRYSFLHSEKLKLVISDAALFRLKVRFGQNGDYEQTAAASR